MRPHLANHADLCRVELRTTMFLSDRAATLATHVLEVVGLRAEKQVTRIAAPAVVARVAHEQLARRSSVRYFPRDAVRVEELPALETERAVPSRLSSIALP